MRIAEATLALAMLGGCSSGGGAAANDGERIYCAIGGAADFSHDCSVERSREGGKVLLIVRHPDGGFRRFEVLNGGSLIDVADGAEPAIATDWTDGLEVRVGSDRYRFPAVVLHDAQGQ